MAKICSKCGATYTGSFCPICGGSKTGRIVSLALILLTALFLTVGGGDGGKQEKQKKDYPGTIKPPPKKNDRG